jgi:hypothetical protein
LAAGYKVYAYTAGTSTAAATYSDRSLSVANTWPIVLDSAGEAIIYVGSPTKLILTTATGDPSSPIWTMDYIGEQTDNYLIGTTTAGTTNNNYVVTVTPAITSLSDGSLVIWTPDKDNTDSVGSTVFTGTGPNDCVFSGPYVGTTSGSTFQIQIDAVTSPNTFKWRKDAEAWVTGVAITGDDQTLKEGVSVNFAVITGHVLNDLWVLSVNAPTRMNLNSLGNLLIYKNFGGSLQTLNGSDLKDGVPALTVYSSEQTAWILINTADPLYASLVPNRIRVTTANDYTLSSDDHGNEICFTNTSGKTLTLPAAAEFSDKFVYITAAGSAGVTIDADGTEKIYGKRYPAGNGAYYLIGSQFDVVQLGCNGVDWHILTESPAKVTVQRFVYTGSAQTYTKPLDLVAALVRVYGGGGGGSLYDGVGPVYQAGGGGGGFSEKYILNASIGATETVTIGAGGAGATVAGNNGSAGGTTSFGAHCTATGGGGGTNGSAGGAGGAGASGNINLTGEAGTYTASAVTTGGACPGPHGGQTQQANETNGLIYGGGATGGSVTAGGTGGHGFCEVWEFR